MDNNPLNDPNTNPNITLLDAYKAGSEEVCDKVESHINDLHFVDMLMKRHAKEANMLGSDMYLIQLVRRELDRIKNKLGRYYIRAHARQDELGGVERQGFKLLDYEDWITLKNYLQDRHIHVDSRGHVVKTHRNELEGPDDILDQELEKRTGRKIIEAEGTAEEVLDQLDVPITRGEVAFKPTGVIVNGKDRTITLPLKMWDEIKDFLIDHHITLGDAGTITETP